MYILNRMKNTGTCKGLKALIQEKTEKHSNSEEHKEYKPLLKVRSYKT